MSEEINENELENVSGGAGMGVHPTSGDDGSQPLMEGDENSSELNRPDHDHDHGNHIDRKSGRMVMNDNRIAF